MIYDTYNEDINLGGKANSLFKLKKFDILIPDFFVISSTVFERFLEENNIVKTIKKHLLNNNFEFAKDIIMKSPFSIDLEKEIYSHFDKLNTPLVSVRSSASNEDGDKKSFAGQYSTCLNIKKDELFSAIKKCWISLYDDNVISYSKEANNFFSMNVIVQKMIIPYCAGVSFSIDPTSRSKNYSYIEACLGNGEKLVSGEVTPSSYVVRRETTDIDFHEGKNLLSNDNIKKIMDNTLKIEQIYKKPMDIEWCLLNDEIYILQARPITAFSIENELIKNIITREKSLIEIELYYRGEYNRIKDLTNALYYQKPIFHFISEKETKIYYNFFSLEEDPNLIFRELNNNYELFLKELNNVYKLCEDINEAIRNKEIDFIDFFNNLTIIQAFSTLGNMAGQDYKISKRVLQELLKYRRNYDNLVYRGEDIIEEYLKDSIPDKFKKYIKVLSINDIKNIENIDTCELEKRLKGFIYYDGEIINTSFEDFCKNNNFYTEKEKITKNSISGKCAFSGKVTGIVKIINSRDDFNSFEKGDIIVAPMTTPKYTPIMKKASGIITDEGGITCHAAIVSRELKLPCLVGCKNATKILKNGMKIELNTINGLVKIIE